MKYFLAIVFLLLVSCTPVENTITIGALLPLSGPNSVFGEEIQNAIELAKDEINDAGGINEKKLHIIYEDDQANPTVGTKGMQKLVMIDKVPVVLGSWVSGVVLATAPIAEENEVIVMASAISPKITNAGDYIFRIQPSASYYTTESVKSLRQRGVTTAAVLYINNEFGESLKDAFVKDFGTVVAVESYPQGSIDFRAQLLKIQSMNPQVIFIAGYQDTINVITQIAELDIDIPILAGPPFENQQTITALGPLAENVLYPYHFVAGSSQSQRYEQAYYGKYGVRTGGFAPLMYDGTYIIAHALKQCDVDTACIKNVLYTTQYNGVTGRVSFDSHGDPTMNIVMKTVQNGEFVVS
jgi:branched-chain amino acid transport system substrate-binding protein